MKNSFWTYAYKPTVPGWYAVLVCYDPSEGMFPGAGYWTGAEWNVAAVAAFGERCDESEQARRLAYENDPDEKA